MLTDKNASLDFEYFDCLIQLGRLEDAKELLKSKIEKGWKIDWDTWESICKLGPQSDLYCQYAQLPEAWCDQRTYSLAQIEKSMKLFKDGQSQEELEATLSQHIGHVISKPSGHVDITRMIEKCGINKDLIIGPLQHLISNRKEQEQMTIICILKSCGMDVSPLLAEQNGDDAELYRLKSLAALGHSPSVPSMECIEFAQKCVDSNPSDFFSQVHLLSLFLAKGCMGEVIRIVRSLDIKQLQLDSLGYLISDPLMNLGLFSVAERFYQEAFLIYDDNRVHTWDYLADAFAKGNLANTHELFEFAFNLEHSSQALSCIIGTLRHELLRSSIPAFCNYLDTIRSSELILSDSFLQDLRDNRDTSVFDQIDASGQLTEFVKRLTPTMSNQVIRRYTSLPVALRALWKQSWDELKLALDYWQEDPNSLYAPVRTILKLTMDGNMQIGISSLIDDLSRRFNGVTPASFTMEELCYNSLFQICQFVEVGRFITVSMEISASDTFAFESIASLKHFNQALERRLALISNSIETIAADPACSHQVAMKNNWISALDELLQVCRSNLQ